MGRRRTKSPDWLPKRCYVHRLQVVYYPPGPLLKDGQPVLNDKGKPKPKPPIALGPKNDPSVVLAAYAKLVANKGKPPKFLCDAIDRWMREILPTLGEGSQETYRLYCGKLKKGLGHMLPDEITLQDLYAYHEAREAPVRANREVSVLGGMYPHFIRWRCATRNPLKAGFVYAEELERERDVTGSERRRFARSCTPRWMRGYITLKYLVGRRQAELLPLTIFSGGRRGIAFPIVKKRKLRTLIVLWSPRLRKVWKWLLELDRPANCPFIFWARKGKNRSKASLTKSGFKSAWVRAQEKWDAIGGTKFWEHDIRASTAEDAEDEKRAQELLDHADPRTTRKSYRNRRPKIAEVEPLR